MGLDMYLKASKYVGGWEHSPEAERKQYKAVLRAAGIPLSCVSDDAPSFDLQFNVAYWRKANAIHSWFVRECQGGVDDCRTTYVSRKQLEVLRDLCQEAVSTGNAKLLQPQGGFFFGSTDIDEWYWGDLKDTVKKLTAILNAPALQELEFYYRSSW